MKLGRACIPSLSMLALLVTAASSALAAERKGDDLDLARAATLPALLARALERNPDLGAEGARAAAAGERAEATGRLPTPQLKYEVWSVPFAAPLSFNRAMMHMVGLRQTSPAFGSRDAAARAAAADREIAQASRDARAEAIILEVRRAFAEYRSFEQEERIRLEHAGLLSRLLEVARRYYQTGGGTMQDQLRLEAELARLHAEISIAMQQRRTTAALLNSLVGRSPDAPLGPASVSARTEPFAPQATMAGTVTEDRPEIVSSLKEIERKNAALEGARQSARFPDLMVGLDYMNQPMERERHGYGAMVSMSLPWLNPATRASVRAEERSVAAARHELEAVKLAVGYEVTAARERYRAAQEVLLIQDGRVVPAARQSYELAQSTYSAGGGDLTVMLEAERAYLLARLELARAAARVESAGADLDRAMGTGGRFAERICGGAR